MLKHLCVVAVVAGTLLSGCGSDGEEGTAPASPAATKAAGAPARVEIKGFIFKPKPLTVAAGTKVTFVNTDATTHTVVAGTRSKPDPKAYKGSISQNEEFAFTYSTAGTYDYFCDLHSGPGMVGQVIVR